MTTTFTSDIDGGLPVDLAEVLRNNGRRQFPEILMEENMPCGWGMCYGCGIFTKHHGVKLCCKDGPKFNLFEVF